MFCEPQKGVGARCEIRSAVLDLGGRLYVESFMQRRRDEASIERLVRPFGS